jgi:hypothetical protein
MAQQTNQDRGELEIYFECIALSGEFETQELRVVMCSYIINKTSQNGQPAGSINPPSPLTEQKGFRLVRIFLRARQRPASLQQLRNQIMKLKQKKKIIIKLDKKFVQQQGVVCEGEPDTCACNAPRNNLKKKKGEARMSAEPTAATRRLERP